MYRIHILNELPFFIWKVTMPVEQKKILINNLLCIVFIKNFKSHHFFRLKLKQPIVFRIH